jgi:hypothetical protein
MATKNQLNKLIDGYIDFLLTNGHPPLSVYSFMKSLKLKEAEFYNYFGSFGDIESFIWKEQFVVNIEKVMSQEIWDTYSVREKLLSFYFSFFESLKERRSYFVHISGNIHFPDNNEQLNSSREVFYNFARELVAEGIEKREMENRKILSGTGISHRYKDVLWFQLIFLFKFWAKDHSPGFEKTDEAIEKAVNVAFDIIGRNSLDNLLDLGKFLLQNRTVFYERSR